MELQTPTNSVEWLTPQEYAEQLRVDIKTVYRSLANGSLEHVKVGRQYRIRNSIPSTPTPLGAVSPHGTAPS